jgi:REP element-mobilizing transposase RayT
VFDRKSDVLIVERKLPHWAQTRTLCFITFRTDDSIPKLVLERWLGERWQWLDQHGIDPYAKSWKQSLEQLEVELQNEFHRTFSERWHDHLGECHGEWVLRRADLGRIVARSLEYFDGQRYELTDYVVMPNHVHLIAAFDTAEIMLTQCESWKHYTATQINRRLNRKGRLWQRDDFDHLVRSEEQFYHLRRYIADNPTKARLQAGELIHYSKVLK